MIETVFIVLVRVAAAYTACGLLVAVLFLAKWIGVFDPSAKDGTWGFRLLITPGVIVLWPLIVAKVLAVRRGGSAAGEADAPLSAEKLRRNHGLAFLTLAIVGPLLFAVALTWRAPRLEDAPAVEVSAKLNSR